MGATCGISTGSIGQTKEYSDHFLKWKHISISRELGNDIEVLNANFTVRLTFEYLKGRRRPGAIDHDGYLSQVRQESAAQPTT